jgi:hypothetical protein
MKFEIQNKTARKFKAQHAVFITILLLFASCVPSRQFEELQAKEKECQAERDKLKTNISSLTAANADLTVRNENLTRKIKR